MKAIHLQAVVDTDGEVVVRGLPYHKGDEIEVVLLRTTNKKRLTAQQLRNSSLIGLWAKRNIKDSAAYARQLREQAQQRQR